MTNKCISSSPSHCLPLLAINAFFLTENTNFGILFNLPLLFARECHFFFGTWGSEERRGEEGRLELEARTGVDGGELILLQRFWLYWWTLILSAYLQRLSLWLALEFYWLFVRVRSYDQNIISVENAKQSNAAQSLSLTITGTFKRRGRTGLLIS